MHLLQIDGYNKKNAKRKETVPHLFCETVSTSQSASQTAPLPRGASGEEGRLYEMPRPLLDRSNNDDRRQWRKQGVVVGAAASKTQAKRCGCWVPQPGQWHGGSRDGEGKPGALKPPHSDKQTLCLSDTIAMSGIRRQHPRPLRRSRASSPKGRASGVTGSLTHKTKKQESPAAQGRI